ncbi:MAG TPA: LemA family protein [Anaeromyxobacteraceae bacterium]|nr:LemA family protein [Anaeromyxobacteraceae bacterium]
MIALLVLLLLLVAVIFAAISVYNGLVSRRNGYQNAFSQIDVQLKRRHDLIPNLVETAKGYLKHERETLEAVVAARSGAVAAARAAAERPGDPAAMEALKGSESALSGVLARFLAVAEAYPDLKANANMMALQEELASTENRIAFARQAYNDAILDYNNARETFPGLLLAGRFPKATPWVLEASAEREPVAVKF